MTDVNVYAPNFRAPKYRKQILTKLKGEIDDSTVIVGDVNAPLSILDRSDRKSIRTH